MRGGLQFIKHGRIVRLFSTSASFPKGDYSDLKKYSEIELYGSKYSVDDHTNLTTRVTKKLNEQLHNVKSHPINLVRQSIQNYFYSNYLKSSGNPLFAVFDNLNPIVTPQQSFDSLLFPENHPGRLRNDTYYVNSKYLLRPHMTAHDEELIKMGFDAFLSVGDVYRRDEIDRTHFPVFHQLDGVRLYKSDELFHGMNESTELKMFEKGSRSLDRQEEHTVDAAKLIEIHLKSALLGVVHKLFGKDIKHRWVDCYFPFTHPSWELEICFDGKWLEVLGSGVLEQKILTKAGVIDKVGWAFGVGLDRLAMIQYQIPDIRLLWSKDKRFLDQFHTEDPDKKIVYKPISMFMNRQLDLSFWVPDSFVANDFHDIVGTIGGDVVEDVSLKDSYCDPKTNRKSLCYCISYGYMEKEITPEEAKNLHQAITLAAVEQLGVKVR